MRNNKGTHQGTALSCENVRQDDAQLIAQFQRGEVSVFDTLFRRHQDRVYRLARRFVKNPEDALDLTQDAFLRAYQRLPEFRRSAQFYTWLHRITVNLCIDFLRRNARRQMLTDGSAASTHAMAKVAGCRFTPPSEAVERAELDALFARRWCNCRRNSAKSSCFVIGMGFRSKRLPMCWDEQPALSRRICFTHAGGFGNLFAPICAMAGEISPSARPEIVYQLRGINLRIGEGIFVGLRAMYANKLRSLLTILGIIIGVASVLAMIAIGDGAKTIVLEETEKFGGASQFTMNRSGWVKRGDRWVRNRSGEYFTYGDVVAIETGCPSVELVIPRVAQWGGIVVVADGGAETRSGYNGVDVHFPIGMKWEVEHGRFFSETEFSDRKQVCVLGFEVAEALFGDNNPIDREVKVSRRTDWQRRERKLDRSMVRLTVTGVMAKRGTSLKYGFSWDNIVFMPLTTAQERFTGNPYVNRLTVKAKTVDLVDRAAEEVKAVIRRRHRNQDDFFHTWFLTDSMEELEKISQIITITLGSIAGFSLLIGGIGIMNMMLVSVTERTREIGLRKAIGAKRLDIVFQFLVEAVIMCSLGGLIGIGLGMAAAHGMAYVATQVAQVVDYWPSIISYEWMIISVSFSAAIGIFFGLYPALKAARLSPIEALRTE